MVSYAIKIDRVTYTFHLEKQSFLDPYFHVYSYSKSGLLLQDSSPVRAHCFYQGYVIEIPKSVVTLSACSGLRGLLQLDNVTYGIEPLEATTTYEHMIYRIDNNKIDFPPLKENHFSTQRVDPSYKILVKSEKNADIKQLKRFMRVQIIMDKALFDYMGSEVTLAAEKIAHIFSLINTMFSQLNVIVILTSLEIWSDKNKILVDGDADTILQRFVSWKEKHLMQRSQDMAYLLIFRDHPNHVGVTFHGKVCDPKFAAGIALYPKMINLEAFSLIMAQLFGVNLGLAYENINNCHCPTSPCIMSPEAIHSHGAKFFSSCSMDEFKHIISQPELECLKKQTVPNVVFRGKYELCGNGILEPLEQCDCGTVKTCTHAKCCYPQNCTLIGYSECGSGKCCNSRTCRLYERGHLCRRSTDPCDFPEHCNGTSEFCVPNVKAADLQPCNNNTDFCFGGICKSLDKQCVDLFGKYARSSSHLCVNEVNFHGDIFGNCMRMPCNFDNVMCGKLVCHWTHTVLASAEGLDIQYTYRGESICMSGVLRNQSFVLPTEDKTYVSSGTRCESDMFCLHGKCISTSQYVNKVDCDGQTKCNGHGVCNSNLNCQCDVGYAPPECEPAPSAPGGSIDDGFWLIQTKTSEMLKNQRPTHHKNGLLISFYIFLPFLILITIIALKMNIIQRFWKKEKIVNEESLSEDSNSNNQESYI
ncbi:A disintegrin and metallopeptidase domain 3-like isoform X2 [Erinaceus europaeus]|uniref:A disintegrin and metallopeptidase domain 3-like isoform X2 n=1 Tax=Erinaceus europaeus TaxID=9365 RepID=A0ABM3WNQ3_ERIEU|nr:A disintegrin and metallopeptidase domain 3-like isoform X2 [Erinaceus europaeus]